MAKRTSGVGVELAPERVNVAQLRAWPDSIDSPIYAAGSRRRSRWSSMTPALAELIQSALAESNIKGNVSPLPYQEKPRLILTTS